MINKEMLLLKLEEVLITKNFTLEVKNKIKDIFLTVLEMNIDNKKIHIESIINGLKKIDTIEFNDREELMKNETVNVDLDSSMLGYVKADANLMVVVKEFCDHANFYHELVHVSQNGNSYNITPRHYSFSGLFSIAIREGEAIYYQHQYQQHKFPNKYGNNLFLFHHTDFYRICLELYRDMKNILGNELLEKWKNIDGNYDIMPEIDEYVKQKYNVKFSHIYNVWASILCYFGSNYSSSDSIIDLTKKELNHQQLLTKLNNDKITNIISIINAYDEYLDILNDSIKAINTILDDPEILEAKYLKELEKKKKELLNNDSHEVINGLKQEFQGFTFEYHKNILLSQKNDSINKIEEIGKELIELSSEKELYEFYSLYCDCDMINLDLYSLAVLKTAMLKQMNIENGYSTVSIYAVILGGKDKEDNINK